jgi:hypothetical protein
MIESNREINKIQSKFAIAQPLLLDSAFHKETLDRIGLLK